MTQKRSAKDRTAAEWKSVAKATRRRRRILQAGFFFIIDKMLGPKVFDPGILTNNII